MMSHFKSAVAAVIFSIGAVTGASAATFDATSVTTGGNDHTFWFSGSPFGGSAYWQFETGVGVFATDKDSATLTGTIVQNGATNNAFEVDITFNLETGPQNGIKCGAFSVRADCDAEAVNWDHYTFGSALLSGVSGSVAGLDLSLGNRTNQPIGQFGIGASDKPGGDLGFSDWFTWTVLGNTSSITLNSNSGNGDINLFLTEDPNANIPPVPLPAGGLLLISGLIGLGAARRFRKQ